jgi:hypothetical protein
MGNSFKEESEARIFWKRKSWRHWNLFFNPVKVYASALESQIFLRTTLFSRQWKLTIARDEYRWVAFLQNWLLKVAAAYANSWAFRRFKLLLSFAMACRIIDSSYSRFLANLLQSMRFPLFVRRRRGEPEPPARVDHFHHWYEIFVTDSDLR